jgi:hypothetical protein
MSSTHHVVTPQRALLSARLQLNAAAASVPVVRGKETLLQQEAPTDANIEQDEGKHPLQDSHRLLATELPH